MAHLRKPNRILITGFAPFGGFSENPSQWIAQEPWKTADAEEIYTHVLPVSASKIPETLFQLLDQIQPSICLHFGLASQASQVRIERIAINLLDMRIPDNDGIQHTDKSILESGETAYFSTLPCRTILTQLHQSGVPAELSYSAGTFICNQAMYLSLHYAMRKRVPKQSGFIHIPNTPEQAALHSGTSSIHYDTLKRAVRVIIDTCLSNAVEEGGLK